MKVKSIPSSWITREGRRLDCGPYMSGALEAKILLERLPVAKVKLQDLTEGGAEGIINAGRIRRIWVTDPAYGVPFLSSSDILQADLSTLPLISKRVVAENPKLLIKKGWTLITRSGTIGRMTYARADMENMGCSEHVMRVLPDPAKIPSGYLYAYLSSKFGVPQVVSGTYGSIIQSIEPHHIADLPVPRLGAAVEQRAHALVEEAAQARTRAINLLQTAEQKLFQLLAMPVPKAERSYQRPLCSVTVASRLQNRADAFYYSQPNMEARSAFDQAIGDAVALQDVADVFIPGIFKRLYADDPQYGYPYITGADVFQLAPTSDRYLMRKVAEEYGLVLHKGMILIQEAGQLGGLIGRSVPVGDYLNGFACTNNMVRVTPRNNEDAGYIYAILANDFGVRLIARESAGSSIPHIEVSRVKQLKIPWPAANIRIQIGQLVIEARELRDKACDCEIAARIIVEQAIEEAT